MQTLSRQGSNLTGGTREMINECPSKEGDLVHIGSKGKWGITQNNHATLTARIAELEQENAKLLDEVTARRFTDERTDKLLDERQAWGEMPPCAICEKCGTAPGYVNAEKPAPHRFSKKFDQNTGKPFNFCMVCGRKEEVLFEPKCSECGHSEHKFLCLHTIELSNGEHDVCDCQSFGKIKSYTEEQDEQR